MNIPAPMPWGYVPSVTVTQSYCTDEDVYIEAPGDYADIVPRNQTMGAGADGVFAAGAPWLMTSASFDPLAGGVTAGMACQFLGPTASFPGPGDLCFVDSVAANNMVFHRPGLAMGLGLPPCPTPAAGLTGVKFRVLSCYAQIMRQSYELDRLYGTDDLVFGRRHVDQYDPRQLRRYTALLVLKGLYVGMARGSKSDDHWWGKVNEMKEQLAELARYAAVTWKNNVSGMDRADPFSTRVIRG